MKIVEKPQEPWSLVVTCKNCETQLELEKTDILYGKFYSGMDAEVSMDYYVTCPVCGKYVFIPDKKLPRHVQIDTQLKRTREQ